jgi:hypothetical protein
MAKSKSTEIINWRLPYGEYLAILQNSRSKYKDPADADYAQIDGAIISISNYFREVDQSAVRAMLRRNLSVQVDLMGQDECHPLFLSTVLRFDEFPWCLTEVLKEMDKLYWLHAAVDCAIPLETFSAYLFRERCVNSILPTPLQLTGNESEQSYSI